MGKAARAKTRRATPVANWTQPTRRTPWLTAAIPAVAITVIALVIWLAARPDQAQPAALTHVHGLGINPSDGALYVATHDGLYQLTTDGQPHLVGQGRQDTMGFTIAGPNHFLASGHPAADQGGPAHLGLIESTDAGATWTTRSLAGEADFHALRYRNNTIYGYNSATGQLLTSTDQTTWQTRARTSLRDFDVHPDDPNTLLATTETGLQRSTDTGTTWTPTGGPPVLLLAWETTDQLWGLTTTGDILRSADAGTTWNPSGRLTGQATALAAQNGTLYAAIHERGILRSDDGGTTWTELYRDN